MEVKYWKVSIQVGAEDEHRIDFRVIDETGKLTRGASLPVDRGSVIETVTALQDMIQDPTEIDPVKRAHELAWHAARQAGKYSHKDGVQ